jgi:hypothetical protein
MLQYRVEKDRACAVPEAGCTDKANCIPDPKKTKITKAMTKGLSKKTYLLETCEMLA